MARDRSPISQRLKSLAQRAGRPAEETERESEPPVAPQPPAADAGVGDDEQPTGEIPVVAEQPTDEQPALQVPEPPTPAAPEADDAGDAPAWPTGPTIAPPVIPPRPAQAESSAGAGNDEPSRPTSDAPASDESTPAEAGTDEDDEPFSPRTTIWPQSTPTPRFEPQQAEPGPAPEPPTFPESSPEPAESDPSALEADDAPTISADAVHAAAPSRAVEVEPIDADPSDEAEPSAKPEPAAAQQADAAKSGVFGKLRRLRPKGAQAERPQTEQESDAPAEPAEPAPSAAAPAAEVPAPVVLPATEEPPAKPSFGERASLRRRAKSLRARRDAGLLELGAIVLDQRRFGDPTGGSLMRRRTDELADIDSELAAIEQVLDDDGPAETVAQLGVVRCLTCSALLGPRDRFCVQCGAPRPEDSGTSS